MRKFACFITFVFTFLNFGLAQRRIYNGREAVQNEFPFVVNVRSSGLTCGGVLLSDEFVLTAAHCLIDHVKGKDITVILGSRDFYFYSEKNSTKIRFKSDMKFWIHAGFELPSAVHDIAIVKLPRRVTFSKNIQPVKISKNKLVEQTNNKAFTIGWGETESGEPADVLQAAPMKLIPISDCRKYQKHFIEKLTENHICAFGVKSKHHHDGGSACDGDSGETQIFNQT